jgi:hypothetical protein
MVRAKSGLVVVVGMLCVAGVCGGSASGSGVVVTPKCIAAFGCAEVSVGWVAPDPALGLDAGSGAVVSSPAGIDCTIKLGIESGVCSYTFSWPVGDNGPTVNVTATAATGSLECTSTNVNPCEGVGEYLSSPPGIFTVPLQSGTSWTTSLFSFALSHEPVTVTHSGNGTGTVTQSLTAASTGKVATQINCGNQCTGQFDYGIPLTLRATPGAGASFTSWTGVV